MKRWLIGLGLAAALLAGCGGDKPAREAANQADPPAATDTDGGESAPVAPADGGEEFVSAQAVLSRSAQRAEDGESFEGTFEMAFSAPGMGAQSFEGSMAFRAPNDMYMTMDMFGERIEMIMRLPDMYMNLPGEGWVRMSLDDAGVDFEQLLEYVENRGPVDLADFTEGLVGVEELGDEYIGGDLTRHFGGDLDTEAILDALPEGIIEPEMLGMVDDVLEGARVDVWVDKETELPRRFVMDLTMSLPEVGTMNMEMTMDFTNWNGDVVIPEPPADARSITG